MNVSAIIVTRGNVDLTPVLDSLPLGWEVIVWDNGAGVVTLYQTDLGHLPIPPPGETLTVTAMTDPRELERFAAIVPLDGMPDLSVYGRYAAIEHASHDVIYVQDDDCVLAPESFDALLEAYEPGFVTANMSEYHQQHTHDSALIGFGAVFDRELPARAFERSDPTKLRTTFLTWPESQGPMPKWAFEWREIFLRTCDVVFTALTPRRAINTPYSYLPCASDDNRMSRQAGFAVEREEVLDQLREIM